MYIDDSHALSGALLLGDFQKLSIRRSALLKKLSLLHLVNDDFESAFMNFYLNDKPYLGQLGRDKSGCCGARGKCDGTPEMLAVC